MQIVACTDRKGNEVVLKETDQSRQLIRDSFGISFGDLGGRGGVNLSNNWNNR